MSENKQTIAYERNSPVVLILGSGGAGKTASMVVNEKGEIPLTSDNEFDVQKCLSFTGENFFKETVVLNLNGTELPFPYIDLGLLPGKNLRSTSIDKVISVNDLCPKDLHSKGMLDMINGQAHIKRIIIDSINGGMNDTEMLNYSSLDWDEWYDFAKDWYRLLSKCNSLRPDLAVYIFGHPGLIEVAKGEFESRLVVNGKKLEKTQLELKVPIVLNTVVRGSKGNNTFRWETQKNKSSSKSPIGMFKDFEIPNSLSALDRRIRQYYKIS